MIPGKYNIEIYRGSTWSISLTAVDENNLDMDFGQYDIIRMQIRKPWVNGIPTGSPLAELTLAGGEITLAVADTQVILTLSADETRALAFDEGQYDLELVKSGTPDVVDKLVRGSVTVIGEITV